MATVINRLKVTGDRAEFERILGSMTAYMKRQPGFVAHRLYRSLRDADVYVELAEWREASDHRKAMQSREFQDLIPLIRKHAEAQPDVLEPLEDGAGTP
ncbi:antibiotic biosynthesis monooxygenase family protein [Streptomyces sp. NPDC006193]|uniref:antibiotic biosynthesis monooxygenase family protein n=1 Tax=Streptomyces sp. NPDC006193 TaxID=3155717 RepID=UPI0033AB2EEC